MKKNMNNMKYVDTYKDFLFEKEYPNFIVTFVNEMTTSKDLDRIGNLVKKAGGNEDKEIQLAIQMANAIKGREKALQRYEAALELLGKDSQVTQIFGEKAIHLGNKIDLDAEPKVKNTRGKLGSADTIGRNAGRDLGSNQRGRDSGIPILPIGVTNLVTGKCKYFNIYETWGSDQGSTLEVWKEPGMYNDSGKDKYKIVVTSGGGPIAKIGTHAGFKHDQTWKPLFMAELVDWAQIGDADLIVRKYGKSFPGYVYK